MKSIIALLVLGCSFAAAESTKAAGSAEQTPAAEPTKTNTDAKTTEPAKEEPLKINEYVIPECTKKCLYSIKNQKPTPKVTQKWTPNQNVEFYCQADKKYDITELSTCLTDSKCEEGEKTAFEKELKSICENNSNDASMASFSLASLALSTLLFI